MNGANHSRPKGTRDFLPEAAGRRHRVEELFRLTAALFGFEEIVTPIFEHSEVFIKSSGETSDIITKETYTFSDRAGRSLTLRPEGTPGVVRAVLEGSLRLPARLFYHGPYFRYCRPQKGRIREFGQLGAELLGEAQPEADAEVITLGGRFFERLGITDCTTQLNSIGCRECRPGYRTALVGFLSEHREELCEDCRMRLERNPLRVLDCKNSRCQTVFTHAPKPSELLCPSCREHFDGVKAALDRTGLRYVLNDRLVRGLDYYNRTTFEYVSESIGAQDSLGGGGRYDYLFEEFGGPPTPAVGLALGLERTMLAMPGSDDSSRRRLVFVVWMTVAERDAAFKLVDELRAADLPARVSFDPKPGRQFKAADAARAAGCIVIGPDEITRSVAAIKNLATGRQHEFPRDAVIAEVRSLLTD